MARDQIIIEPAKNWKMIDWAELRRYRDLFYFLVARDVKVLYKQTILGFGWAILRPVISMIIFTIIFGNLAEIGSDGVPYAIFNFAALVPWLYFSSAMTAAALSLVNNSDMLTKVYFPRLAFPVTAVIAKLVDFAISLVLVFLLMAWFRIAPTTKVLYLPFLTILLIAFTMGLGLWLAAMAVQYRDVKHALPFLTQIMMYAAPVVWPVSLIEERFGVTGRLLFALYPMVGIIEGFRSSLLTTNPMPWDLLAIGSAVTAVLLISGLAYFRRMEAVFADVV
jgi:lipopolysaccharide transport system permease protein